MFSRNKLSVIVTISLLVTQVTFLRAQQNSNEDGWTTLTAGQNIYGIRYENDAVIVNNELVMACVIDPQFPDDTKVYISPPTPLKKYVLVMCWDDGGKEAYVINTRNNRVTSRDVVPKHWRTIKWVSWSPDERFALVAAAGEVTNGDMAFVDLQTNRVEEIHFKNFTRNPQQQDEIQDFNPSSIAWVNANTFSLKLDVRCNPYDGDESCLTKILRSHNAQVGLAPFRISYPAKISNDTKIRRRTVNVDLVGTTWKLYTTDGGLVEWGTYTFLAGGNIEGEPRAKWKLVGNKLTITEEYGDIELVIKGNVMTGSGQLGMSPRPFRMRGNKIQGNRSAHE